MSINKKENRRLYGDGFLFYTGGSLKFAALTRHLN